MQPQRQGDEHPGRGKRGASSLKNRLLHSPSVTPHELVFATTLTACHGCLKGGTNFVFATIFTTAGDTWARATTLTAWYRSLGARVTGQVPCSQRRLLETHLVCPEEGSS